MSTCEVLWYHENLNKKVAEWVWSIDLSSSQMLFVGSDKSFEQWKYIWYRSLAPCDAVCIALWEGESCSTDAAFQ